MGADLAAGWWYASNNFAHPSELRASFALRMMRCLALRQFLSTPLRPVGRFPVANAVNLLGLSAVVGLVYGAAVALGLGLRHGGPACCGRRRGLQLPQLFDPVACCSGL